MEDFMPNFLVFHMLNLQLDLCVLLDLFLGVLRTKVTLLTPRRFLINVPSMMTIKKWFWGQKIVLLSMYTFPVSSTCIYTFSSPFNTFFCVLVNCCSKTSPNGQGSCPIMAWIHPGDNMVNDGSPYKFGPQMFMNHDVVLVSIQYRLGPFGFLRYFIL